MVQAMTMSLYIVFMIGQWFMLGKEIDHRLKIFFKANSSLDRVVYRLLMGMTFFILYFNFLSLFPSKWIYNLFWVTWVLLGLFYSWPTRGKIIQESVSSNFYEFRFLDSFEKTLVGLIFLTLLVSMPMLPTLTNFGALKLFFDPTENIGLQFWNFLEVNYYPFRSYPELYRLALSMHFYFVNMGLFLVCFYALCRYFVSRRLSLLGVFALLSSWSFTKILSADFGQSLVSTYSLIFIWSVLWVTKSATYRSGLFVGVVGYLGTLINFSYAPLIAINVLLMHFVFLKDKTTWYKKQSFKYSLFGLCLVVAFTLTNHGFLEDLRPFNPVLWQQFQTVFFRKGFNLLAIIGVLVLLIKYLKPNQSLVKDFKIDREKFNELLILLSVVLIFSVFIDYQLMNNFGLMWPIVLFALIPIELLFQSISRLRSRRNMIYLIYIMICLLDSHFEGRVKIFARLFDL